MFGIYSELSTGILEIKTFQQPTSALPFLSVIPAHCRERLLWAASRGKCHGQWPGPYPKRSSVLKLMHLQLLRSLLEAHSLPLTTAAMLDRSLLNYSRCYEVHGFWWEGAVVKNRQGNNPCKCWGNKQSPKKEKKPTHLKHQRIVRVFFTLGANTWLMCKTHGSSL